MAILHQPSAYLPLEPTSLGHWLKQLPAHWAQTVRAVHGTQGENWLAALPLALPQLLKQQQLKVLPTQFPLSYQLVVGVLTHSGQPAILKLGLPNPELTSEVFSLCHWQGQGAVKLLQADPTAGWLLLEWLLPTQPACPTAAELTEDEARSRLLEVLKNLHKQPVPEVIQADLNLSVVRGSELQLIPAGQNADRPQQWPKKLQQWFECFASYLSIWEPTPPQSPLPIPWVKRAAELAPQLLQSAVHPVVLLHGDLHHGNLLSSERGWLAIDPKGILGPATYEVFPFLRNQLFKHPDPRGLLQDRLQYLQSHFPGPRLSWQSWCQWGLLDSVMSAIWDWEDFSAVSDQSLELIQFYLALEKRG